MQLKLTRSQRDGGMVSTKMLFCLDARVAFTEQERACITRYKLGSQVIYNSEASKRLLDKAGAQSDGSMVGGMKSLATLALAAMKLNISIASLERGQHIECKDLAELRAAEDAIVEACQNLREYLDTAATFDGREILLEFNAGQTQVVAQSTTPAPMLVKAPPQGTPASEPMHSVAHEDSPPAPASEPTYYHSAPATSTDGNSLLWAVMFVVGGTIILLWILNLGPH